MTVSKPINPVLRDFDQLSDCVQVRLPVVKALLGVSSATVWRLVKQNKLSSYKLTERTTTFNVGELKKFLAAKASA